MNDQHKKLTIAIVCDAVTDCVAGSFISTLRFSELLTKKGHKVIFITGRSPRNPKDGYHNNIKTYRFASVLLPKSEGQLYISFPTTKKVIEIFKEEGVNVVHIIIPTPSAVVAIKAARLLGIKVIAHSHTQPENLTMHLPNIMPIERINRRFYRYLFWLYTQAHAVVYPTEFAKQFFPEINAVSRTLVISNGVDTTIFKKVDTKRFFEKFNLSREKKNILYVGRLHPEKSVDTFIKSIPHVINQEPNTHFFIVGFGHLDKKLERLARTLNVHNHITFFGKVSDEDLILAYNACDIFVLPSLAELEGMAVLEAMACGKPILIANSKGSASTYFVDQNGFLFEPEDHGDLAARVLHLLKDEDMRNTMGEKSFQKSKEYDIRESVSRLEELYYSLLPKE